MHRLEDDQALRKALSVDFRTGLANGPASARFLGDRERASRSAMGKKRFGIPDGESDQAISISSGIVFRQIRSMVRSGVPHGGRA